MNRNYLPFFSAILILTPFLLGCQRMVEKEKMDTIGKWAIDICKCAEKSDPAEAKSCAAALQKPVLQLLNSSGRTQYKLDSVHAYDDIESMGTKCQMKIP